MGSAYVFRELRATKISVTEREQREEKSAGMCLYCPRPLGRKKKGTKRGKCKNLICLNQQKKSCQSCISGVPRGGWGVQTSPPEILKALQNRAKLNPIVKTVKNC